MIKVLIADDHQVFLDGLKMVLEQDHEIQIVGQAINGKKVLSFLDANYVDVVVLDLEMPEMNGIEVTQHIRKVYPHVKILILTMYEETAFVMSIIKAQAHGYALKNIGQSLLIDAIKTIAKGGTFYPPKIMNIAMEERLNPTLEEVRITKTEKKVLVLIAKEYTTVLIAKTLNVAETTVNTHRRNLLKKTKSDNVVGLIKYAFRNKLIDLRDL